MSSSHLPLLVAVILVVLCPMSVAESTTSLTGQVVDADTAEPLACRIYVRGEDGKWYFPGSASPDGSAVTYQKQNWANKNSVEMHTTLSAHPFVVKVPRGEYEITVERGKEYFPQTRRVTVGAEPVNLKFRLKRWINMAQLGYYSGDTHVHRTLEELPNVQLAEDLNVSFPLLYWVTKAFLPPGTGDKSVREQVEARPIFIDDTHVMYPLNTEYEIFSVNDKSHTLGAVFVLNHKSVFQIGVPPVGPVKKLAREEGGLLELDKHNWPWSMMLVPIMGVDLFELTNNHIWRTEFAFARFGEAPPEYMQVEKDAKGFTERGWIEYGFANYYTLLNCGFRLRPTAGTATGVHPVPLGFGRVYVKLEEGFDYDAWVKGLDEGRSFVTTGPMLFVTVNDFDPGHFFGQSGRSPAGYSVAGRAQSAYPLGSVEIIVNGRVAEVLKAQNQRLRSGAYLNRINTTIDVATTSWIAVRCFEDRPDKRPCFAHTGPFHIRVEDRPLQPEKGEIEFLIKRMREQIERNEDVLPSDAVEEYRRALNIYQGIAKHAR
ncbi:MAG: CehA/McbA family metallohydrolase [Phycisphaerales bacterium]|nr:MAG: CehA/McbA family metallohydrolase [Phycisphaerales bacterium]